MEDYNKIIESLNVRFIKSKNIRILQPVKIQNYYDVENSILILNRGEIHYGEDEDVVSDESILFIPGGKMMSITYGSGDPVSLIKWWLYQ